MSSNPWGPNEPAEKILAEKAWLQGAFVTKIFYGMLLILSWQCFHLLLKQTNRSNYKSRVSFLVIVLAVCTFGTFHTGYNMQAMQEGFIENRNYPGGPSAFESHARSDTLGNIAYILMQWLCDALLIWRFVMIYQGCFIPKWIIVTPPLIVYLGSCATGGLLLNQLSFASPLVKAKMDWTIPYFSISLGLNILLTIAIVARLLVFRRWITSALGSTHGSQYTGIASILIESASLYSIFSIFFIIPFARNSPISAIPLQAVGQVQGCATLLIVFRVASGKAWASNTQTIISTHIEGRGSQMNGLPITFRREHGTTVDTRTSEPRFVEQKDNTSSVLAGLTVVKDIRMGGDTSSEALDDDSSRNAYEKV